MSTVNLGRIKPIHRGAYSGTTNYSELDIVAYQGSSYLCTSATDITGTPPVDASGDLNTGWQLIAGKGDCGDDGEDGTSFSGTFSLNSSGELILTIPD